MDGDDRRIQSASQQRGEKQLQVRDADGREEYVRLFTPEQARQREHRTGVTFVKRDQPYRRIEKAAILFRCSVDRETHLIAGLGKAARDQRPDALGAAASQAVRIKKEFPSGHDR